MKKDQMIFNMIEDKPDATAPAWTHSIKPIAIIETAEFVPQDAMHELISQVKKHLSFPSAMLDPEKNEMALLSFEGRLIPINRLDDHSVVFDTIRISIRAQLWQGVNKAKTPEHAIDWLVWYERVRDYAEYSNEDYVDVYGPLHAAMGFNSLNHEETEIAIDKIGGEIGRILKRFRKEWVRA
ncbi:hypothetical protein [Ewingella americana]|uniref:Uncharacterized protein n=1 Tax=Ewingella americana TaxID=41202 RepID=A0A502GE33_9GAMM|nr:hypothetical protein [Ewingella americana]TPG59892.1 hypothetical protein EAH77_15105 [Ewingella americana]